MKLAAAGYRLPFALALAVMAGLSLPRLAHAEEPVAVSRLRALESIVTESEDAAERRATVLAAANLATGAISIGVGSYAAARGAGGAGTGLIIGGGITLATGSFALASTRRDEQLEAHLHELARGENPSEALHQAELAWWQAAERTGKARTRTGTVAMILGGLLLATGTVAAVVNIHLPNDSATLDDRVSFGGALAAVGGTLFAGGAYTALTEDPIESSWRTYARLTSPDLDAGSASGSPSASRLQITPTFGPGGLGVVGTF